MFYLPATPGKQNRRVEQVNPPDIRQLNRPDLFGPSTGFGRQSYGCSSYCGGSVQRR